MTRIPCRASHCWQEWGEIIAQRHCAMVRSFLSYESGRRGLGGQTKHVGPNQDMAGIRTQGQPTAGQWHSFFWGISRQLTHWTVNWQRAYDMPGAVLGTSVSSASLSKTFQIHLKCQLLLRVVSVLTCLACSLPSLCRSRPFGNCNNSFPGFSLPLNCQLHQGSLSSSP